MDRVTIDNEELVTASTAVTIRPAAASDAEAVGRLAREFADYLRGLGDPSDFRFTAQTYLRDGFGPNPAFRGLVAESEGAVVGYLPYHFGYDTDRAERIMHVVDLYVNDSYRRRGAGRALMAEAARICCQAGAVALTWTVYAPNALAAAFYERLGARYASDLKLMYLRVPAEAVQRDAGKGRTRG
jgi:ribosomal protein S18 acetylase RimI-like enzyme